MEKFEVVDVLEAINRYYPALFKIDDLEEMTDAWYIFLHEIDKHDAMKNLQEHIKTEKFPPSISELLKLPVVDKYESGRRAIPNAEQTKLMLESYENKTPATREQIDEISEKVWEILENIRIERGEPK